MKENEDLNSALREANSNKGESVDNKKPGFLPSFGSRLPNINKGKKFNDSPFGILNKKNKLSTVKANKNQGNDFVISDRETFGREDNSQKKTAPLEDLNKAIEEAMNEENLSQGSQSLDQNQFDSKKESQNELDVLKNESQKAILSDKKDSEKEIQTAKTPFGMIFNSSQAFTTSDKAILSNKENRPLEAIKEETNSEAYQVNPVSKCNKFKAFFLRLKGLGLLFWFMTIAYSVCMNMIYFVNFQIFQLVMIKKLEVPLDQSKSIMAFYPIASIVVMLFSGWIIHRFSKRTKIFIVMGLILITSISLLLTFTPGTSLALKVIPYFLLGVVYGFISPLVKSSVPMLVKREDVGIAYAFLETIKELSVLACLSVIGL